MMTNKRKRKVELGGMSDDVIDLSLSFSKTVRTIYLPRSVERDFRASCGGSHDAKTHIDS